MNRVLLSLSLLSFTFLAHANSEPPQKTNLEKCQNYLSGVAHSVDTLNVDMIKVLDREASEKDENVFFSPFSISQALTMTATGAAGRTAEQMVRTLNLHSLGELSHAHEGWKSLLSELNDSKSGVQFKNGNSIWFNSEFNNSIQFNPEFIRQNEETFDAKIAELDFSSEEAVSTMNGWVAEKTNNKIKDLLSAPIPPLVVSYLLNAVWFKGSWTSKFDAKLTTDQAFHLENGQEVEVKMMHQNGDFHYARDYSKGWENPATEFLRLPYGENKRFAMDFVLPPKGVKIADFMAGFDRKEIDEMAKNASHVSDGNVSIPRFKAEFEATLNDTLKALGMNDALKPGVADFSNMSNAKLYISKVKHKAVVEVNEEGAEAAAATSVEMSLESFSVPFDFVADRPFYFEIRDTKTETVLFSGVMRNPTLTK